MQPERDPRDAEPAGKEQPAGGPLDLTGYVGELTRLVEVGLPLARLVPRVGDLKRRLLAGGSTLSPSQLRCLAKPYTRNLLYRDPRDRFVVLALLWSPEVVTPIHDHGTWGVMGVYENQIGIRNYQKATGEGAPTLQSDALVPRGEVGFVLPPAVDLHQMRNPSDQAAVTVHTYGALASRCNTFCEQTGRVDVLALGVDHDATAEVVLTH